MALPEDDVEEIDPEPALARILDHEHDAIVVGPGLRPGLATAELVRQLIAAPGERRRPDRARRRGAALDRDPRRLVGRRAPTGRPDPACRRVRPPPRRQRPRARRATATSPTTTRRGWPPPATPPRPGARWSCSRARARSSPPRMARWPSRRSRTRPSRAAAPATCWPARSAPLLAQGLDPFAAARLGVYLHGAAGEAVRERFGDAGLLASDLPDGLAIARKRLATLAERRRSGKRLGFGAREATPADLDRTPGVTTSIADRLAAARTAAAAEDGLAGDRPRRASGEPRGGPRAGRARASPSSPWSRPMPTAMAPSRSPAPWRRPGPTASAWPRCDEALPCAAPASACRSSCSIRLRRRFVHEAARAGIVVAAGDMAALTRTLAAAASLPGLRRDGQSPDVDDHGGRLDGRDRGGDGAWPRRVDARRRRRPRRRLIAECARRRIRRPVDPPPGERGRGPDGRRSSSASTRVEADVRAAGVRAAPPPRRRERRPDDGHPRLRRRAPRAGDLRAACPMSSTARRSTSERRRSRRPSGRSCHSTRSRSGSPTCAVGDGVSLRPDLAGHAGRAGRDAAARAMATAGPGLSNRAEALVRGQRVPLVGNVAMDARHGRRHRRPGPPVTTDDVFVAARGEQGGERITAGGAGAAAHHEPWEVVTQMARGCPGCTMRPPHRSTCGRSPSGEGDVARIELWNGDICDLEVDAIVNPANLSLWMATGVGGAIKRAGGDAIEFAAVRQAPVPLGEAIVTTAGTLAAQGRHPCRLAGPRPPDQRPGHRAGRPQRDGPRSRHRRDEHRLPGARDRRRRLPARRGRAHHRRRRARRAEPLARHRDRDLRAARRRRLPGLRRGPARSDRVRDRRSPGPGRSGGPA